MTLTDSAAGLIQSIINLPNYLIRLGTNVETRSLVESTQVARVEPLTILSKDLITVEYTPEVMQTLLSLFTGYYLQAISLSVKIQGINVIKVLDRVNPDRHLNDLTLVTEGYQERLGLTKEGHKYRLPTLENRDAIDFETQRIRKVSLESLAGKLNTPITDTMEDPESLVGTGTVTHDDLDVVKEVSNLAIGKFVKVTIESNGQKAVIPVNIRLATNVIPTNSIVRLLTVKSGDESLTERYHSWRAGRIEFIRDLILAQDLIDEHKKAIMNDESGVYSQILDRVNRAKSYGALSHNPSLVSASNIFVISNDVAREIETKLHGKLSSPRIRDLLFKNTYAMLIVVVDKEWDRVTIYTRGINSATDVSVKEIKAANKGKGVDPMDVLKALTSGNAPSF